MAEKLAHQNPEDSIGSPEHDKQEAERHQEALREKIEQAAEKHHQAGHEDIRRLEKDVEKKAETSEDLASELNEHDNEKHAEKDYTYSNPESVPRAVLQARKQLKPAERTVSKIIHNSKVEAVSSITGGTVARPSGFMYGALFSFIATLIFLIASKHYGYEYNAFIGIATFVGGYFFGLIVELILRMAKKSKV